MPRHLSQIMAQVTFLCFNIGKAVAPFIVTPFLSPDVNTTQTRQVQHLKHNTINDLYIADTNGTEPSNATAYGVLDIAYAFTIISLSSLVFSISNFAIFMVNGCKITGDQKQKSHPVVYGFETSKTRTILMFIGFLSIIFIQCGMETADSGLITSYISEYLKMGKELGVAITGLYQGVKVIACIVVVAIINKVFPSTILLIDILLLVISTISMTIVITLDAPKIFLWISIAVMALGASNFLATEVLWLETRQPITGKVSSIICVSFGVGGMLIPWLTSVLLESYGAVGFPLVMLVSSVICLLLYIYIKLVLGEGCCPDVSQLYVHVPVQTLVLQPDNKKHLTPEYMQISTGIHGGSEKDKMSHTTF